MITRIVTTSMTREEWLAERRKSLGGSDIGGVLGMSSWSSPFSVWAEKTGKVPDKPDTEAMRIGRDLEDYVAKRFTEASGYQVKRVNSIIRNDKFPHLHANIDRRIVGTVLGDPAGLECKTASAFATKRYISGEFPPNYYAQCVAYMAVTEYPRWFLAVLIMGREFKIYGLTTCPDDPPCPSWCESMVYVSPEEIEALKETAIHFWRAYVLTNTPPPVDGTDPTSGTLTQMYPGGDSQTISLFGMDDLPGEYLRLQKQKKGIEKEQEKIKQALMEEMEDAESAECADGRFRITWKSQERKAFSAALFRADHPEIDLSPYYSVSKSRVMRIMGHKEEAEE